MHRRYALPVIVLLVFMVLLTACGGSTATDTPKAAVPTTVALTTPPPTAPTTAAASAVNAATRPANSAATGSPIAATSVPATAAGSASAVAVTRPASSATTGSTAAPTVSASSATTGTRPAGSATTGSVTAGSTTAGAGLTLFTDPKGRFSFSRPATWIIGQSTSTDSVVQFSATSPLGIIDISTETVASGTTPDTYREAALAEIKKGIPDAQQVGTTSLQLDTEPAMQIDYTGTVSGNTIYFSQIFALHKGTAYILTLGTQPADIAKMKQQAIPVIQTWKFLQ